MSQYILNDGPQIVALANFNNNGTLLYGYNVASISDLGLGNWVVTYTTALPHDDYAISITVADAGGANCRIANTSGVNPPTTTNCRVYCFTTAGASADSGGHISFMAII